MNSVTSMSLPCGRPSRIGTSTSFGRGPAHGRYTAATQEDGKNKDSCHSRISNAVSHCSASYVACAENEAALPPGGGVHVSLRFHGLFYVFFHGLFMCGRLSGRVDGVMVWANGTDLGTGSILVDIRSYGS